MLLFTFFVISASRLQKSALTCDANDMLAARQANTKHNTPAQQSLNTQL
jgi:hypothetical protein